MELVFELSLHKELYNWLLEDITRKKRDWPRWKHNGGDIEKPYCGAHCFACGYADKSTIENLGYSSDEDKCMYCPFDIDINKTCLNGLYLKYSLLKESYLSKYQSIENKKYIEEKIKNIITQIRDFPIKKDIKYR